MIHVWLGILVLYMHLESDTQDDDTNSPWSSISDRSLDPTLGEPVDN